MITEQMIKSFINIQKALEHPTSWFSITGICYLIDHYVFSQWDFAIGFFIIFIIDTLVGSYCAFQMKNFSFKKFRKMLCDKSIAYFSIIISYSVGTKIVLEDGSQSLVHYLDIPFYSLFVSVELGSIVKNWYEYKRWPWLRTFMKHLEGYSNETGKEK